MIRVIMGKKGSGKTKQMIDMINNAVQTEHGNVVCIERGSKLTYDIHYQIRLVEASSYDIDSYATLKGFVSGLYAGNYDITQDRSRPLRQRDREVPGLAERLWRETWHQVHHHHQ